MDARVKTKLNGGPFACVLASVLYRGIRPFGIFIDSADGPERLVIKHSTGGMMALRGIWASQARNHEHNLRAAIETLKSTSYPVTTSHPRTRRIKW